MTEFEAERGMPAGADAVFAVVSDLDRLPEWLPEPVDVRSTGDGEVHADVADRGVQANGTVAVRPEQLRVEWGHAPSTQAGCRSSMPRRDGPRWFCTCHSWATNPRPESMAAQGRSWKRG